MTRFAMQNARRPNDRYWMAGSHISTSLVGGRKKREEKTNRAKMSARIE